ncbi:MAG: MoxR family ATPase [Proteobacteria bacterium]|nr:MoxR family ATPase [Pseudomonadota bacterium]NOG60917.1 MoxR family ATPase [Pseudomonadota bacterium]
MSDIEIYQKLSANIEKVIQGQSASIRKLLAAFFSDGHILLEDVPGTGKTTLAKALAKSIDVEFQRIQFTPDLLPTDILGVSIFNQRDQDFEFHKGPIFSNILLADEINRASPRTQSALLEAMGERQISIERNQYQLDDLFFVIATQNPVEYHGTYPLPEAQMDRFAMRFGLGFVELEEEIAILDKQNIHHPIEDLMPCISKADVTHLKQQVSKVNISDEVKHYMVNIVRTTRESEGIINGASPRASISLMKAAQALALFDGLDYVTPDHIQEIAIPVISHRIMMDSQSRFSGHNSEQIIENILSDIPVPT